MSIRPDTMATVWRGIAADGAYLAGHTELSVAELIERCWLEDWAHLEIWQDGQVVASIVTDEVTGARIRRPKQ